jgi:hypothetical protein
VLRQTFLFGIYLLRRNIAVAPRRAKKTPAPAKAAGAGLWQLARQPVPDIAGVLLT